TKILSYRAVIGEYQPHSRTGGSRQPVGEPITDYFPAIIQPDLFHAVQAKLEANRGKGGRIDKAKNVFTHLVKCAYCGGPLTLVDKGKGPKGHAYLICDNGRRRVRDAETGEA